MTEPKTAAEYLDRGCDKDDQKDSKGAIDSYTKAIEINPKDSDSYLNRGSEKYNQSMKEIKEEKQDQIFTEAVLDWKRSSNLSNKNAKVQLHNIEESLRKVANSDSKDAEDCAKFLNEHFQSRKDSKDDEQDETQQLLIHYKRTMDNLNFLIESNLFFEDNDEVFKIIVDALPDLSEEELCKHYGLKHDQIIYIQLI